MPTYVQLVDAVMNLTNATNMNNRWILDKDWVQGVRNEPGFITVTPGQLNKAISTKFAFLNNKFEDTKSGKTIFFNKYQVVTNPKEKKKRKICFYYVLAKDSEARPEYSKTTEFWQSIWDDLDTSFPTDCYVTTFK